MTIEEIFSNLRAHMLEGTMMHDKMASAYSFLNLRGYHKNQIHHYLEEIESYRNLQDFYLDLYHKLIPEKKIEEKQIFSTSWYKYTREDVDVNTKRSAIKDLMQKWINWEKETKKLYETSYKQLFELGEMRAAAKLMELINDVSEELIEANNIYINLETVNYDIVYIIDKQDVGDDKDD